MKKTIFTLLLLLGSISLRAQNSSQGLTIWFDQPTTLQGMQVWNTNLSKDVEWESQSLPIGNGYMGANILGSVEANHFQREKSLERWSKYLFRGCCLLECE